MNRYASAPRSIDLFPFKLWLGSTVAAAAVTIGLFALLADFTTVWIWLLVGIITVVSGFIAIGIFVTEDHAGWMVLAGTAIITGMVFLIVGGLVDNAQFYDDCAKTGGTAISDGTFIHCYPQGVPVVVTNR